MNQFIYFVKNSILHHIVTNSVSIFKDSTKKTKCVIGYKACIFNIYLTKTKQTDKSINLEFTAISVDNDKFFTFNTLKNRNITIEKSDIFSYNVIFDKEALEASKKEMIEYYKDLLQITEDNFKEVPKQNNLIKESNFTRFKSYIKE